SAGQTLTIQESATAGFIQEVGDSSDLVDRAGMNVLNPRLQSYYTTERRRKQEPIPRDQWAGFYPAVQNPSDAVRAARSVLPRRTALPLREAVALETEAFLQLAGSAESKRLIAEFFASRKK